MEENASRALMIGAGIFMTVIVLSALLSYIYVAREMSRTATSNLPKRKTTIENIEDVNKDIEISCSGIDFINFLRRISFNEYVEIEINHAGGSIVIKSTREDFIKYVENGKIKESFVTSLKPNVSMKIDKKITDDGYTIYSKYTVTATSLFYDVAVI